MRNYLARRNNEDYGLDFFGDVFQDFFKPVFYGGEERMRTDIKETEKGYELWVDMPGYDKKDLSVTLNDGYLTVSAKREEKEQDENYLRRERSFSCSRSYYVGNEIKENDIKAKYQNGILTLDVPKKTPKELEHRHIVIE